MNPALLPLLTFGAVFAAVAGIYSIMSDLYLRDRSRVSRRVDDEFRRHQREQARKALLFKDLGLLAAETEVEREWDPTFRQRFEAMIEQSGLGLTPRKLLTIMAVTGLVLGALAGLLCRSVLVGLVAALFGSVVPVLYVQRKRNARIEELLSQLPDAFDLMSRVIRSGQTMSQALQAVTDEFPQPIAGEFSYCHEQQNLGLPSEAAMRALARRTGLVEIKIFVLALLVQQQTGGNLAELLDKLSAVIRQRYRIRGQINALTAEGRLQARVLIALPIVLFLGLLLVLGDYERELLKYPRLMFWMFTFEGIGALWIRKIMNFDF
ncbi:MAG: type II secretion system F family protein [Planctomycetaceae bacterium]|nr:type II secretion system F family protein [Planctomycetaceae bacterium]MBV8266466.1 type II secretion system F family protein [Planctomycetaceae bacterium]MBV8315481.1 type II secretion system F family protein [Planctomycetaceae bacterium]MBV8606838.1 type II secretion system F family protein [Singulisphaera sp.]MBV8676320.1 type II secretion system F family protein [Planctomycetaceae bacterium]